MPAEQLKREANPPSGQLASPIPQFKIAGTNPAEYESAEGSDGAIHQKVANATGTLINPATSEGVTSLGNKLDTLATQATLADVLTKIIAAPATEAKQDSLITLLESAIVTEGTILS